MDEDWFYFFFDKVKLISDETLQNMWSRILSGEINSPGLYSKTLMHTLSIMSKEQASVFTNIARFCLVDGADYSLVHPLLFVSVNRAAYKKYGITVQNLKSLERLGLLFCDFKDEFVFEKKKVFRTGNNIIEVYGDPNNKNVIKAGNVVLTDDGQSLFSLVPDEEKHYRSEVLEHIVTKFELRNCSVFINGKKVTAQS